MNNFIEEIKKQFGLNNLDSKTMIFRYNGFISACNMNLDNSRWNEKGLDTNNPYINKERKIDGEDYSINFSVGYETGKGKVLILLGTYDDLSLFLVNYCDSDIIKFKVNEVPFKIKLKKPKDNITYLMEVDCDNNRSLCDFRYTRSDDNDKKIIKFDSIISFEKLLKIVESFVKDPEYVFNEYSNIIDNREIHFTKEELNKGIINEEKNDNQTVKKKKR